MGSPQEPEAHVTSCAIRNKVLCLWPRNLTSSVYRTGTGNLLICKLGKISAPLQFLTEYIPRRKKDWILSNSFDSYISLSGKLKPGYLKQLAHVHHESVCTSAHGFCSQKCTASLSAQVKRVCLHRYISVYLHKRTVSLFHNCSESVYISAHWFYLQKYTESLFAQVQWVSLHTCESFCTSAQWVCLLKCKASLFNKCTASLFTQVHSEPVCASAQQIWGCRSKLVAWGALCLLPHYKTRLQSQAYSPGSELI